MVLLQRLTISASSVSYSRIVPPFILFSCRRTVSRSNYFTSPSCAEPLLLTPTASDRVAGSKPVAPLASSISPSTSERVAAPESAAPLASRISPSASDRMAVSESAASLASGISPSAPHYTQIQDLPLTSPDSISPDFSSWASRIKSIDGTLLSRLSSADILEQPETSRQIDKHSKLGKQGTGKSKNSRSK